MKELEVSKTILEKIILNDVPFALAIRNGFKKGNIDGQARSNITALLGCELRHHIILNNLIERYFENPKFEDTVYLRFLVTNKLFLHRYKNEEIYALAIQTLEKEKVDALMQFVSSTNEIIPSELDKASPEYLSMRFNTPAWVIKMWQKQYGKGVTFKILKCNYHQSTPSVRVNERVTTAQDILNKYPDFAQSPVDNILVYQGRGTPKHLEEFKTNKIFFMKMATKYVIDKLEIEPIKRIAIYSDVPNNIYLDLVARFGKDVAADVVINHTQSFFECKKVIEENRYDNIRLYNASYSSLITCISHRVGTMICLPKNTIFDLLRSTPDYFIRVKQEKLDEIIKEESESLEEASRMVELDGNLVYMIPTVSKKESSTLIGNFLYKHPEFELIEEKQFFPFEAFDSCLYYAIMRRKGESND